MTEEVKKQWVLLKQRISKGDLMFEEEIQVFDCEKEAHERLEGYRQRVSPAWPDFDDYALREIIVKEDK
ncbi:MAG: hypothetical protein PHD82_17060 [Candidatus Riflebacteria bacterium]|nr:hypothetical protein [Candidatus Riflebacteria bacterium]